MSLRSFTIAVAVVLLLLTAGYFAVRAIPKTIATAVTASTERALDLGAVVTRMRDLNRLETATMRIVHVGTVTQSYDFVPDRFAGDTLTLMATGDVVAGVDLAQLRPEDVWRRADGTVVVRLPPPQILMTRIDNGATKVIARKTGMFRRSDNGLEGRARMRAEAGVRNEAVNKGILKIAGANAQARIADLLHAAGAPRVVFVEPGRVTPLG
jgi:hypothetical protein